jgi:L-rhamnose mutarotase
VVNNEGLETQAKSWVQLGGANLGLSGSPLYYSDLTVYKDKVYVIIGNYVRYWTGSTWKHLISGRISQLAVNNAGDVFVSYADKTYNKYYVKRWNGQTWQELGEIARGAGGNYSMYTNSKGNPIIAYMTYDSFNATYTTQVTQWNGKAWQFVGTPFVQERGPSTRSFYVGDFSVDSSDRPYIFQVSGLGNGTSTTVSYSVLTWNGTTWQALGFGCGYTFIDGYDGAAHFELISDKPNVVCQHTYTYTDVGNSLDFFKWNGSEAVKTIPTVNYKKGELGLLHGAQGNSTLYITNSRYADGKIMISRVINGRLEQFGPSIAGFQATIATSPTTGPVVAYYQNEKVYVKRWQ